MNRYLKKEALHTGLALVITVAVAVAGELIGISSFQDVSLSGLAVTAVRSFATGVFTLGTAYLVRRKMASQ